jgi:hypothetical protein
MMTATSWIQVTSGILAVEGFVSSMPWALPYFVPLSPSPPSIIISLYLLLTEGVPACCVPACRC